MANRTYLVVSDHETVYPSYVEPGFDPAVGTVAQAPYRIPLLWMGMFREMDMQHQEIDGEMGRLRMLAPLTTITSALRQLREAIPVLEGLFESGTLNEFYDMLSASLLTTDRKYVTIELEEVAYMYNPRTFFGNLNQALRDLDVSQNDGESEELEHGELLLQLAQLQPKTEPMAVPPARCIMEGNFNDAELSIHAGIIGCQWLRRVHWETDLQIPIEARVNPSMDMIYAALFDILCCVMSVDGTVAASERSQLLTILGKVGVDWTKEEVASRLNAFAKRVQQKGYSSVLEESLGHVPMFKRIGRDSVLTRCIDLISEADGIMDPQEDELCQRISAILRFADS